MGLEMVDALIDTDMLVDVLRGDFVTYDYLLDLRELAHMARSKRRCADGSDYRVS